MMNEQTGIMNDSIKELVAIAASVGAHCQPCLEYHIQAAVKLGINPDDIREAIEVGHRVEKGAMVAMKKFSASVVDDLPVAESQDGLPQETVLTIYDPAMCCSSGVCGPSVDPVLARFAGTLKSVSDQPGIRVERYNLGQQPQAFVENPQVKTLLEDGGEKNLPFIFINDQLWSQTRYPEAQELLEALGIKGKPVSLNVLETPQTDSCCGDEGGCC